MSLIPYNNPSLNSAWNSWHSSFQSRIGDPESVQYGRFRNIYPSVLWTPNYAQERPFSLYYSAPYPRVSFITFGNGTGKTDFLGEFLAGVVKGKEWVNPVFCQCDFFDELTPRRDAENLTIWWVCDADLMKMNAPDYKAIKSHIPDAIFKGRDNKLTFHEIHIPIFKKSDGAPGKIIIQVKTHGQDSSSFAGENVHLIICDEPPPEIHWSEMIGRIRSKKGEPGARIVIGGTPLEISGYLFDYMDDPDFANLMVRVEGSIWENCVPEDLPDEEATKLKIPRDENGDYMTRGHLTKESIDDQIAFWSKSKDPMEVKARTYGVGSHTLGRVYKTFKRSVHVITPFDIPKEYPLLFYADPHDARDDVGVWFVVTPLNKLIAVAEYPDIPYEMLWDRRFDIAQTCDEWIRIQTDMFGREPVECFGDPNKFEAKDAITKMRRKMLYANYGFHFNTHVTDDLTIGHEAVRKMLWCDEARMVQFPGDPTYQPQVLIFDTCRNCVNYMIRYSTKIPKDLSKAFTEGVDQKFKDFPDLIRYAAVTFKPYSYWIGKTRGSNQEWSDIQRTRRGERGYSFGRTGINYEGSLLPSYKLDNYKNRRIIPSKVFR